MWECYQGVWTLSTNYQKGEVTNDDKLKQQ